IDPHAVGVTVDGLLTGPDGVARCWGPGQDPMYVAYHDDEWGKPVHDDVRLFEKLCLEGFQSGLSWLTILRKRENFRAAFARFDPVAVAAFDDGDVDRLLGDAGIVRHRGKIAAAIVNAAVVLELARSHGSFAAFVWGFAPPPGPRPTSLAQVPASTPQSTALARELKRHGARFVGPTTAYAFMQSMGLVDDHLDGCHVAT
ncbi:MAG TPA: DNA-3-methyladenine glycosylase I, partial [Euzebya sp.]|nr:DNA-3-methyladenine glycosylase I [Euzebya sp.]